MRPVRRLLRSGFSLGSILLQGLDVWHMLESLNDYQYYSLGFLSCFGCLITSPPPPKRKNPTNPYGNYEGPDNTAHPEFCSFAFDCPWALGPG